MDMKSTYVIETQTKGKGKIDGLKRSMSGLNKSTSRAAGAMARLKTQAGGALNAMKGLVPLIGTAAMGKFVNDTLQAGDRLEKFSQSTGVAVPLLDKLRKSSELAGTNFNTLVKTFPMLARNINETSLGMGKAKDAFEELGISVVNSDGSLRKSEQVLLDIADKFKNMEDGTKKASLAYDLFGGKTSEQLIPLLNSGRDAIEGMGTTMTEHGVKRMAEFNDSMTKVKHVFQDMFVVLTTELLPTFKIIVEKISEAVKWFNDLDPQIKSITVAVLAISGPLTVIAPIVASIVVSIAALKALEVGVMVAGIGTSIKGLAIVLSPFLLKGAIIVGIGAGLFFLGKAIGKIVGHIWLAKDKVVEALGFILGPIKVLFQWAGKALNALRALFRAREQGSESSSNGNGNGNATAYAEGGFANSGGQLAYVGEAGGEYIVPSKKVGSFARNILGGIKGEAAIPRFAEGGFTGNANVSITTGPVTNMNGTNYVTTQDLSRAVQSGVNQTMELLTGDLSVRRQLGLA